MRKKAKAKKRRAAWTVRSGPQRPRGERRPGIEARKEMERELVPAAQRGRLPGASAADRAAVERLLAYCDGYVWLLANRFARRTNCPLDDLHQEGQLGLLHALRKFDISRGNLFLTYAARWVYQYLQQCECRWLKERCRVPTLPLPDWGDGDGGATADPEPSAPGVDRPEPDGWGRVADRLRGLTERERTVLRLRFGLDGRGDRRLHEVGELLGVSKERVRKIQDKALRKLRGRLGAGRAA